MFRRAWIFGFVVALMLAIAPAAWAAPAKHVDTVVVLSGHASLQADETTDAVVVFHGSATIDGHVTGAVTAFDAPVTISGRVDGDVIVFNGKLRLLESARVDGDVYAEHPIVLPGATVTGVVRSVHQLRWAVDWRFGWVAGFAIWLALAVSVLIVGLLLLLLAPRGMDAIFRAAATGWAPAIGWGIALLVGIPVLGIVAMATLVGIPFGLGLLFAIALLTGIGQAVSAWVLGRALVRAPERRGLAFLAGWAILSGVAIVPWVGGLIWGAATAFGLGMSTVALWRARRPELRAATPPMPGAIAPAGA